VRINHSGRNVAMTESFFGSFEYLFQTSIDASRICDGSRERLRVWSLEILERLESVFVGWFHRECGAVAFDTNPHHASREVAISCFLSSFPHLVSPVNDLLSVV